MPAAIDLTGHKYGQLTVLDLFRTDRNNFRTWLCKCECFSLCERSTQHLRTKKNVIVSCPDCAREKKAKAKTTHGGHGTRLYTIWEGMRSRCNYRKNDRWKYYGGKGITICKKWADFENFREWALSNKYNYNMTIDRVNSSKNYTPSNCEWVTRSENSRRMNISRYKSFSEG